MNRRQMLQGLLASGIAVPAWANGWSAESLPKTKKFNSTELTALVDCILPKTDTPGAIDLNVPKFVQTMLADCSTSAAQDRFKNGLSHLEKIGFSAKNQTQKSKILTGLAEGPDPDLKGFVNQAKWLSIQGYTLSEYYKINVEKFEFAPGRFLGCVDVNTK